VIALICLLILLVLVVLFTMALCKAAGRADKLEEVIKYKEER